MIEFVVLVEITLDMAADTGGSRKIIMKLRFVFILVAVLAVAFFTMAKEKLCRRFGWN